MSKELELFKRWFGWDPFSIDDSGRNSIESLSIKDDKKVCTLYINWITGIENAQFLFKRSEFQILFDGFGYIGISYDIPSQYHSEWEQYVKEMDSG